MGNKQSDIISRCLRALRCQISNVIVMDSEKYFTENIVEAPETVKFMTKNKFYDKILMRCFISFFGLSLPGDVKDEAFSANVNIPYCLPKCYSVLLQTIVTT